MTIYVGIDPGVHACGVAACDSGGNLIGALWARTTTKEALAKDITDAVLCAVINELGLTRLITQGVVVGVEWPELTRGRARGAADTSDLVELAYTIGRIMQGLNRANGRVLVHVMRVRVSSWKKNVNTDALAARLELPPPVGLTPVERSTVRWPAGASYRHNVVDAIALAKWLSAWPWKNPSKHINDFDIL